MKSLRFVGIDEYKNLIKGSDATDNNVADDIVVRKFYNVEAKAASDDDREIEFAISSAAVDRDDDTLNPKGWSLSAYKKNPVVLWAHSRDIPPIAKATKTWLENDKLRSIARFLPEDLADHDHVRFSSMIYEMYKKKFLRAASVGFKPKKWAWSEDRDMGIDFEKQELLEWSGVPVGSNPDALAGAKAAGIDLDPMVWWTEEEHKAGRVSDEHLEIVKNASCNDIVIVGGTVSYEDGSNSTIHVDENGQLSFAGKPEEEHKDVGDCEFLEGIDDDFVSDTIAEPEAKSDTASDDEKATSQEGGGVQGDSVDAEGDADPSPLAEPEAPAESSVSISAEPKGVAEMVKALGEQLSSVVADAIKPLTERIESLEGKLAEKDEKEPTQDVEDDDELNIDNISEKHAVMIIAAAKEELETQLRRVAGRLED